MAIPEEIQEKLDSDPNWTVQHVDIVRLMDEIQRETVVTVYDPAKS